MIQLFKHILIAMALTFGLISISGCSGGEADYSLEEVQGNQFAFLSSGNVFVEDNATEIVELVVRSESDVEFIIVGGDDSALFDINATTGLITYANDIRGADLYLLDPERIYNIVIEAVNLTGQETKLVVRIKIVKDLTLVKPIIDKDVITDRSMFPSLTDIISTITAESASNTVITYVLSGSDSQFFTIDVDGNLYFKTIPGFSPQEDADQNNIYEVTIDVSDAYQTSTIDIRITIASESDLVKPTILTSKDQDYVENDTTPIVINATSGTTSEVRFSLVPGYDETLFTIDPVTGYLYFINSPDYEAPRSNIYNVVVRVTDQSIYANEITKLFTITISGVNEGIPNFTSGFVSLKDDNGVDYTTSELSESKHYTMIFNTVALDPTDVVTLTLSPYDTSSWDSDKNRYDANVFSAIGNQLSIDAPSVFISKDFYLTVTATDEHGNYSVGKLIITVR